MNLRIARHWWIFSPFEIKKRGLAFCARREWHRLQLSLTKPRYPAAEQIATFVIATPRSGSSMLIDYLNCLENSHFHEEILNPVSVVGLPWRGISEKIILNHIRLSLQSLPSRHVGAKLMIPQLDWHNISPAILQGAINKVQYIVLYRRDLLAQFISRQKAQLSDQWSRHGQHSDKDPKKWGIDFSKAPGYYRRIRRQYLNFIHSIPPSTAWKAICYEDLCQRTDQIFEDIICPLLNTGPVKLQTNLIKQNLSSPESYLPEDPSLCEVLQQNRYFNLQEELRNPSPKTGASA